MKRLIAIKAPEELLPWSQGPLLPPLRATDLVRHAPNSHWILARNDREVDGRCSLWWRGTPSLPGHRVGVIGHYAVRDSSAARRLLQHACEQLAGQGCSLAVGPMDGNTWRRYRLLTERGSESVFFLEPDNPDDWPGHFRDLGFRPLAHYFSSVISELGRQDPRIEQVANRLHAQGIRIRAVDPDRVQEDLRRIYAISISSFRKNFLFMPIDEAEFVTQYRNILPLARPELILLAEQRGVPIGFLFAIPDLLQAQRGQAVDTVVLKTLAVLPDRAHAGLGSLLVAHCHGTALSLGYTRAIHALMHESNPSRNIRRDCAQTIRRYTLFARSLRG